MLLLLKKEEFLVFYTKNSTISIYQRKKCSTSSDIGTGPCVGNCLTVTGRFVLNPLRPMQSQFDLYPVHSKIYTNLSSLGS